MIPQRKLTRNGFANGIGYRVEACRKRLRFGRTSEAQTREEQAVQLPIERAAPNPEATTNSFGNIKTRGKVGMT